MTIIVASLFLPYQPQFELSISQADALDDLIDPNLVKVSTSVPEGMKKKKDINSQNLDSPSYSREMSPTVNYLLKEPKDIPPIYHNDVVSSKLFFDNLTSHASNIGSPIHPLYSLSRNTSVEHFFSSETGTKSHSHNLNDSTPNDIDDILDINDNTIKNNNNNNSDLQRSLSATSIANNKFDTTANLLKNVNKSLLYQSLFSNTNNSQSSIESASYLPQQKPSSKNSTVITPKSKIINDSQSAIINVKMKQSKHGLNQSFPSMRRSHSANTGLTMKNLKPKSSLKYEQTLSSSSSSSASDHEKKNDTTTDSTATTTTTTTKSDKKVPPNIDFKPTINPNSSDLDLTNNVVPKFGGYSNNAKFKANVLKNSSDLFKKIPWRIVTAQKGNGGLKNAIETAVIEETIVNPVSWVGTVGIPTDEIPDEILSNIIDTLNEEYDCTSVITDDITFKGAYKNFSKQILWPTLHYQIPDNPLSKAFEVHSWSHYSKLNKQFADKIVQIYKPGDTIWIHDYHLMLVPQFVREQLPDAKIGFFLHVSFPSSEVFRCLAQREKILQGICGSNFVGFQTKEYARHFLQTTNRLLMADISDEEIKYNGTIVSIGDTPVGIDMFYILRQMRNERTLKWRQLIRERWQGKKLIVCRDQFDRTRGLSEKMIAYERFLRENPNWIDKVVLIQICIGYGKDTELEKKVMLTVDRINSLSEEITNSQPVVFLHQDLEYAQYLALSCEADAFLITAFREGMNLTSHEFISCSEEKNAPLLLSEFTGSAELLRSGAVLINPWDTKNVAHSIKLALEMTVQEKRRRWKRMSKDVIAHDSDTWVTKSLNKIDKSWTNNRERLTSYYLNTNRIIENYKNSKKHMFIIKLSQPPTSHILSILNDLCVNNIVFVISAFSKFTMESLFNRVFNLGLIAENGAYVKLNGSWYNIVEKIDWKPEVIKIFEDKAERLPGSYFKVADSMIRFHTENAEDQERISTVIGEAMTHINTMFDSRGIHAAIHNNIIIVQQLGLVESATNFILRFYNSTSAGIDRTSLPSTPAAIGGIKELQNDYFQPIQKSTNDKSQFHVDFLCISGSSSPVTETLFSLVKKELNECDLKFGHSIVYGNATSTNAKEHVVGGNELFKILYRLAHTHSK